MAETPDLTPAQRHFLRSMPHAIVATIRKDGTPQLTPTWYLWDGEAFTISTLTWTQKYKNLRRDPRITLCIDGFQRHTQYVQVSGRAEIVEGDVADATRAIIRKYEPDEATTERHWQECKPDRIIIRLRPDRWQWRYPDR
jgi:PPOX class probable F420-dependent enzyme